MTPVRTNDAAAVVTTADCIYYTEIKSKKTKRDERREITLHRDNKRAKVVRWATRIFVADNYVN